MDCAMENMNARIGISIIGQPRSLAGSFPRGIPRNSSLSLSSERSLFAVGLRESYAEVSPVCSTSP